MNTTNAPQDQSEHRKDLQRQLRETRQEMKKLGIKRTSCFNGGLDGMTYRLNARVFELETMIAKS